MANVIKLGHSNTSGHEPNALAAGEIAINSASGKIWVGNGSGNSLLFNTNAYAPASADASQSWVNSNFSNNAGDITAVTAGTGMSGGGTSGSVTLNCTITDTNTWRGITNSVSTVDGGTSASATAVKTAYDRSWPNTTYTAGTGMTLSGTTFNCSITDTHRAVSDSVSSTSSSVGASSQAAKTAYDRSWPNTWRGISNSVSTVDAGTSASLTAVKSAYDRSWPNTTYTAGTGMSLSGTTFNCNITDTNTWRSVSDSVSSTSSSVGASSQAVKTAYDRSWPNTTYSAGTGMSLSGTTFNCTVSTAGLASTSYVTTQINNLIDSAPGALNTLNELAAAIGDDANYATTITNALAGKSSTSHNHSGVYANASHSHSYLPLSGGTLDGGTNTTLQVRADNEGVAKVEVGRSTDGSQGTGVLELTQDGSYGGGMSYNGDNSPSFASGETADWITFYGMNAGTRTEVFGYSYASTGAVTFNGALTWSGGGSANANTAYTHSQAAHAPSNANYITNNNQLTNGAGYTTNVGDITGVTAGTGMSGGGSSGTVTLNCSIVNTWRGISDSVSTTNNSVSASQTAVKAAYDRSWPNTTYSAGTGMSLSGTTFNCSITDTNTWRGISNSVSTVDAGTSASLTAVKSAYDRSWPNTTYTAGTGMSLSGTTFNCTITDTNTWRGISDSTSSTSSSVSASSAAVKAAYDRYPSEGDHGLTQANFTDSYRSKLNGISYNAQVNRSISSSISSTSTTTSASSAAAKSAYDRSWPNTTYSAGTGMTLSGTTFNCSITDTNTWRAIGTTSSTSMRGDHGTTAYNHSQAAHAPSNATTNTGTVTSVATGTGLTGGTITSSGTLSLSLGGLPDMTAGWSNGSDEFIVLDNGSQARKLSSEIFGSNAFNSTTIPTSTTQLSNGNGFITSSQTTMNSTLFGGGSSGVTNQGISKDIGYKLMNGTMSVGCVTTIGGSSNEYLRYASGGTFSWDTIEWNHIQNVSALTALP